MRPASAALGTSEPDEGFVSGPGESSVRASRFAAQPTQNLTEWLSWLTRVRFLLITILLAIVVVLHQYTQLVIATRYFVSLVVLWYTLAIFYTILFRWAPLVRWAAAAFGGRYIMRTENITAVKGTAPKRFVVIAFESLAKAQAWYDSPAQKEVGAILDKTTTQRQFFVEGMPQ